MRDGTWAIILRPQVWTVLRGTILHRGQNPRAHSPAGKLLLAGRAQVEVDRGGSRDGLHDRLLVHAGINHGDDLRVGEPFVNGGRRFFRSLRLHGAHHSRTDAIAGQIVQTPGAEIEAHRAGSANRLDDGGVVNAGFHHGDDLGIGECLGCGRHGIGCFLRGPGSAPDPAPCSAKWRFRCVFAGPRNTFRQAWRR